MDEVMITLCLFNVADDSILSTHNGNHEDLQDFMALTVGRLLHGGKQRLRLNPQVSGSLLKSKPPRRSFRLIFCVRIAQPV